MKKLKSKIIFRNQKYYQNFYNLNRTIEIFQRILQLWISFLSIRILVVIWYIVLILFFVNLKTQCKQKMSGKNLICLKNTNWRLKKFFFVVNYKWFFVLHLIVLNKVISFINLFYQIWVLKAEFILKFGIEI